MHTYTNQQTNKQGKLSRRFAKIDFGLEYTTAAHAYINFGLEYTTAAHAYINFGLEYTTAMHVQCMASWCHK